MKVGVCDIYIYKHTDATKYTHILTIEVCAHTQTHKHTLFNTKKNMYLILLNSCFSAYALESMVLSFIN
jgi:hypothetical protein